MPEMVSDEEKTARFRAFWTRAETDRPLIAATLATFPSMRAVRRRSGLIEPDDLDIQENLRELDEEWEAWRGVMGDAMFVATPLWAFPWHSAMAGCPIQRDADNLWSLSGLDDWGQLEGLRFDPGNRWFRRQLELTEALVRHAAGRYPVSAGQLMLGPVDMMMQLRGQERLALDFYDSPDMVLALRTALRRSLRRCRPGHLRGRAAILGRPGGDDPLFLGAGGVRGDGGGHQLHDVTRAHRRFVAPLHRAGPALSIPMVHLHSAQLHTVPNLLEVAEVAAIQVTPDFGEDLVPSWRSWRDSGAQAPAGPRRDVPRLGEGDHARLPARGLALLLRCDTAADAARVLGALL